MIKLLHRPLLYSVVVFCVSLTPHTLVADDNGFAPGSKERLQALADRATLVVLKDDASLHDMLDIEALAEQFSSHGIVWIGREAGIIDLPPIALRALAGSKGIILATRDFVPNIPASAHRHLPHVIRYFNRLKDGSQLREWEESATIPAPPWAGDAVSVPGTSSSTRLPLRLTPQASALNPDPLSWNGTNGYIGGRIAIYLFLVESAGSENYYTWTEDDIYLTMEHTIAGVSFWLDLAPQYNHTITSLTITTFDALGDPRVNQPYEPVFHPVLDNYLWVNPIMANCGYTESTGDALTDRFRRVEHFNSDARSIGGYDSVFSIFVGYNPPAQGAPGKYAGLDNPIAYLGGPYIVWLAYPFGSTTFFQSGIAHEMGHMYWACDEYVDPRYACSCTMCDQNTRPPNNGTTNGNCENSCGLANACIMRYRDNTPFLNRTICSFTAQQVGWGTP